MPLLIQGIVARHLDRGWKEKREGPQTGVLCAMIEHFGRNVMPLEDPRKFPELAGVLTLYGSHGARRRRLRIARGYIWKHSSSLHAARVTLLEIVFSNRASKKRERSTTQNP